MHTLKPFVPLHNSIQVFGDLKVSEDRLLLDFKLNDPEKLVQDSLKPFKARGLPFGDELWKTTCFECFLAIPGDPGYWEINLSPHSRRWALYRFEDYRDPQPPAPSEDFELVSIVVTLDSLSCEFEIHNPIESLHAALTAVIKTGDGIAYFSLKHRPDKPDFHWREGFVIEL